MNIAGVIVHTMPDMASELASKFNAMEGVEVHAATDDGKLVVTVEDGEEGRSGDRLLALQKTDGILSTSLVYHGFDPEA